MAKIVHNNIIDKSPHKTYSKTLIDSKSGCKNLIQSILYLKDNSIIFNKTKKSQLLTPRLFRLYLFLVLLRISGGPGGSESSGRLKEEYLKKIVKSAPEGSEL